MSRYTSDKLYDGEESIAVALDIGTTSSGVAFTHYFPGYHPQAYVIGQVKPARVVPKLQALCHTGMANSKPVERMPCGISRKTPTT